MNPKVIAYYLPQFYPFKENDEWWGKGFTEWTNVGKAKPLFKGHQQPRVPADLGYYDLRLPEVREQQAQLAREAGVTAFCYWHYWFGDGKRLLERVFDEVLETGKPDFPFCLGWANHPWKAKTFGKDDSRDKVLMPQTYPGIEDAKMHFDFLLKAFQDPRYVKIEGKPFFLIFAPNELPQQYVDCFLKWTVEAGFPGLYMVANVYDVLKSKEFYLKKGYSAVVYNRLTSLFYSKYSQTNWLKKTYYRLQRVYRRFYLGMPANSYDYQVIYKDLTSPQDQELGVIPQIMPQWDHSPRSGMSATLCYNCTPEAFYDYSKIVFDSIKNKPVEQQIVMLKSWNEWGEGNYIEPDLLTGKGFLNALRKAINDTK